MDIGFGGHDGGKIAVQRRAIHRVTMPGLQRGRELEQAETRDRLPCLKPRQAKHRESAAAGHLELGSRPVG